MMGWGGLLSEREKNNVPVCLIFLGQAVSVLVLVYFPVNLNILYGELYLSELKHIYLFIRIKFYFTVGLKLRDKKKHIHLNDPIR